MIEALIPLLVVVPILAAVIPLVAGLWYENVGWSIAAVTATVLFGLAAWIARSVFAGGRIVHELGGFSRPIGIELVADELSAMLVLLNAAVVLGVLAFARTAGPRGNAFYSGYLLLAGGVMGVALTGDVFNLFVFLEVTSLTTYALVASDRSGASAYASLKYLIVGTVGASLYLIGVGYAFLATGTLNMIDLRQQLAAVGYGDPLVQAAFGFVVAGFLIKMAVFPVHVWQPDAYQRAPDTVTTYISALVSTGAAYALIRVTYGVFTVEFLRANEAFTTAMLVVAGTSIVAGSTLAVTQTDLKRVFAYSSVAQFGMIAAAVAIGNRTALLGAMIHLVGHGLLKGGLFLGAGLLRQTYDVRTVDDLAGLARTAPYTAGGISVLGLALVGVPPSVGFVGKWYMALGAVEAEAWGIATVIFLSTLLSLLYVGRIVEQLYFGEASTDAAATEPEPAPASSASDQRPASDGGVRAPAGDASIAEMASPRVPRAGLAVLVLAVVAAVALGFAGVAFADVLDPVLGRFFA
ncbi:monovalent cation/H+ antiporter subunit D family protein [Haloparvum sp. PAK95]|uniref:monovalent cation/H+ antiporter subunit D family protein n=1 Tax=Haloparvum sp. PAK95 TaxID=3418962 RepID=UPI003D2EC198